MSRPILDLLTNDYFVQTLLDVLGEGGFTGPAGNHHFTLGHETSEVVFDGDFTHAAGAVTGGIITGFHIYKDGVLLASASNYAIDVDDLAAAIEQLQNNNDSGPARELVDAHGLVINDFGDGSEVYGTDFGDVMRGHEGQNGLSGLGGNDQMFGGAGSDVLLGGAGDDILSGGKGGDDLQGWTGRDTLLGGRGSDRLEGGSDRDTMTGGFGHDAFVFHSEAVFGNRDRITDFKVGADHIELHYSTFGFDAPGDLATKAFHVGPHAHDKSDRIIYDDETGALYIDGDGKGGLEQEQFAILDKHLALTADDILLFSA